MYEDKQETPEEELKRADHLVFVSLKYTRTCDIMKNAIKRMIAAYELSITEYLEHTRKNKQITEVPTSIKERVALIKKILDKQIKKYLILYKHLKEIDKAEYTATQEFRKNVTLTITKPRFIQVKVPDLFNSLETTKEFVSFIRQKIK